MNAAVLHAAGRRARPAGAVATALPGWRLQAAIVFALQMGQALFESVRDDHALLFEALPDWIAFKLDEVMRQSFNVVAAVAMLQLLGRRPAARPYRGMPALLALLLAALVSAAGAAFALPHEPVALRAGASASLAVWFWYTLWANAIVNLFSLMTIDGLHEHRLAADQLSKAQERGRLVREELASARLLAIQARVDPQLLFDMLTAVERFYAHDIPRAERLLDGLSAFLRSALPRLRSARSTLQAELGLARSHVQLLHDAGSPAIELQASLPRELEAATFPAGVLLPLLGGAADAPRRITLQAAAQGNVLVVQVRDTRASGPSTIEALRGALRAVDGDRARLAHRPEGAGADIRFELPLEPA